MRIIEEFNPRIIKEADDWRIVELDCKENLEYYKIYVFEWKIGKDAMGEKIWRKLYTERKDEFKAHRNEYENNKWFFFGLFKEIKRIALEGEQLAKEQSLNDIVEEDD